ncbi:MAG: hypothetical protein H0W63_09795 [Gemmatimonadaceae bacterium]|nr:hypothetical protein [Gemmatimonadaceae bacterium]
MAPLKLKGIIVLAFTSIVACSGADGKKEGAGAGDEVPAWPLSTKSAEARDHFEKGERGIEEGRIDLANAEFKRSVASDSAFALGYARIAQYGLSFDEYKANLERSYAYATTANPVEKLQIEMGRKLFVRDQQGAVELAQQLVALQPKNPRAYLILSNLQLATGDVAAARASAKKAVNLSPNYGGSHLFYGNLFLVEPKDLAMAEREILAGGKLWPDQPLSYDYLGDVRRRQGRLNDAAAAYTRQIEVLPTESEGHNQRGHAYTFLGEYDKARADYADAARLGKGNSPAVDLLSRALVDVYAGNPDKGLAGIEQLVGGIDGMGIPEPEGLKINTLDAEMVIASHLHKFDIADRAVARIDSLNWKFAERSGNADVKRQTQAQIAWSDGRLAAFKGNFSQARSKVDENLKLTAADRDPTKNRSAHAVLGFVALFQKHFDEAIKEFEQGDPDNIYQTYHRGLALEGAGRAAEAKAIFKRVAVYNFNGAGYAVIRADAIARAK